MGRGNGLRLLFWPRASVAAGETAAIHAEARTGSQHFIHCAASVQSLWRSSFLVCAKICIVHGAVVPELHQISAVAAVFAHDARACAHHDVVAGPPPAIEYQPDDRLRTSAVLLFPWSPGGDPWCHDPRELAALRKDKFPAAARTFTGQPEGTIPRRLRIQPWSGVPGLVCGGGADVS